MTEDGPRRRPAIEVRTPRETRFQPHTPLGTGAEFDMIRRMLERWGPRARRVGDDAAVITGPGERPLVVSTDTSVENVHFRKDWLTPEEIGYRAATAALSDLAAMGARPLGILAALTIPGHWRESMDSIADGIGDAAASADAPILGGDISCGTELSLTFTVLGTARTPLLRSGARPGDKVYLTGRLGGPGAALRSLESGREPIALHRDRFARPAARIREAVWLAGHGATAAIDISDGLAGDLGHVAAASGAEIHVELERVPLVDGVSPSDALRSGEEYELIVTSPVNFDTAAFESLFGVPLTEIGLVRDGSPGVTLTLGGEHVEAPPGYLHFKQ